MRVEQSQFEQFTPTQSIHTFKIDKFFCLQTSKRIQENFRKNQTKQFRRSPCRDAAFSGHGKESGSDFPGKTIRNSGAVSARRTSSHSRRPTRLVQLGCYSGRSTKRKCPTAFPGVDHRHHRTLDGEPWSGDVRQVKQNLKTFSILNVEVPKFFFIFFVCERNLMNFFFRPIFSLVFI